MTTYCPANHMLEPSIRGSRAYSTLPLPPVLITHYSPLTNNCSHLVTHPGAPRRPSQEGTSAYFCLLPSVFRPLSSVLSPRASDYGSRTSVFPLFPFSNQNKRCPVEWMVVFFAVYHFQFCLIQSVQC